MIPATRSSAAWLAVMVVLVLSPGCGDCVMPLEAWCEGTCPRYEELDPECSGETVKCGRLERVGPGADLSGEHLYFDGSGRLVAVRLGSDVASECPSNPIHVTFGAWYGTVVDCEGTAEGTVGTAPFCAGG